MRGELRLSLGASVGIRYTAAAEPDGGPRVNTTRAPSSLTVASRATEIARDVRASGAVPPPEVVTRLIWPPWTNVTTLPSAEIERLAAASAPSDIFRTPVPSGRTIQAWLTGCGPLSEKLLSNAIHVPAALIVELLAKNAGFSSLVTCRSPVPSRLIEYTSVAAAAKVGPEGADDVNTMTPPRLITRFGEGASAP